MPYLRRYNFLLALLFVILVPFGAVQAQGITVTVQVQATLHNGPGREFAPLGGVSPNTTVPALGRSIDNVWIQVNASGTVGWLLKIQVAVNGDLNALPVKREQGGQTTPVPTKIATITSNSQWTPQTQSFNGVDMVLVPPGCFTMGTATPPSLSFYNEMPTTNICFDQPFWIDKTDVTQSQFKRLGGTAAQRPFFVGGNRPVEAITWFEARDFCVNKRIARLPTEAEWEYAARGPDDLIFPWGNTFDDSKIVQGENHGVTADVGSKPAGASWVGALDMSGNVSQWVNTLYKPYPYNAGDGRESNTDTSNMRVLRGGSWDLDVRSTYRLPDYPTDVTEAINGFRCARSF